MNWSSARARISKAGLEAAILAFCAVLCFLLYSGFLPDHVMASNDGPLGELMSNTHRLPSRFSGCWQDLNNIGFNGGAASPSISSGLQWLMGPILFAKFYAFISLLILGIGAWCFFRQSRLTPAACILGGLAAILNSTFFSLAAWGLGAQVIAIGMAFLALAGLTENDSRRRWLLWSLAGFAVGMDVVEGADVGALFSILVAIFVVCQAFIAEGNRVRNIVAGAGRLILIVLCAAFLAVQTVQSLVSTSVEGVAGTQQDAQTKAQRWNWATQWSLPKTETLGLLVPGLFGFRMDTPGGGEYWGLTGHDARWDTYVQNGQQGVAPTGFYRYSGGGNYIGLLAALVAFWAAAQSLRGKRSVFSLHQRKWLWLWTGLAVISLLLALGRYAPFYRWLYALPYFSTVRNPTKFLYVFSFAVVILFAYGIDGLCRKFMNPADVNSYRAGILRWWGKAGRFDRNWAYGCGVVWLAGLVGWYLYWQHQPDLIRYLQTAHLDQPADKIAAFSVFQPIWFAVFFFVSAALFIIILSGAFTGPRASMGPVLLGLVLVTDLALADRPWVVSWNYPYKYMSNPVIDFLRDKPYEHRAVLAPIAYNGRMSLFRTLYKTEWMEQQFPYYNVQTFDIVEMPRVPQDFSDFSKKLNQLKGAAALTNYCRGYELTDTRYVLAPADFDSFWNAKLPQTPLQRVLRFDVAVKPGLAIATNVDQITAVSDPLGSYGVFELPSALPRAKLYNHWQVNANNTNVLQKMFGANFDPQQSVFVAGGVPDDSATNIANPPDDAVDFVSYAPKDIVLKANASARSILLLNDHFYPDWKVSVDGQPAKLLRCNFIMQGVYLLPGMHTVEFKYRPPMGTFYVSLAAAVLAVVLLGIFLASLIKSRPIPPAPAIQAASAPQAMPAQSNNSKQSSRKKRKENERVSTIREQKR